MVEEWNDLPQKTLQIMKDLGNFGPTVHAKNAEVKGYALDDDGNPGKTYYTSADLRDIAAACNRVADWLDKRAEESND